MTAGEKTQNGNQFWGYATFNYSKSYDEIIKNKEDYRDFRNEYVIVHLFDKEGKHINTRHCLVGTASQADDITIFKKLEELIAELGEITFNDIEVEPFETMIDGILFGLVPNHEYGFIELQPNATLAFGEPWDGSYLT